MNEQQTCEVDSSPPTIPQWELSTVAGRRRGVAEAFNSKTSPAIRWDSGPNFFIVGAAKSATTSLHDALADHPDIYMSPVKEPGFFATDLNIRSPWAGDPDSYLSLFANGRSYRIRGESTPAYLLSGVAARNIFEYNSAARIVIVLRNPIDTMQAIYAEARKWGTEPKTTFERALRASERGRPKLEARPGGFWLRYRDATCFSQQVSRYTEMFPPEQILVMLFDDVIKSPQSFGSQLLDFLGADPRVALSIGRSNSRQGYRSALVQRFCMKPYSVATSGMEPRLLDRTRKILIRVNTGPRKGQPMSADFRQELAESLREEIQQLQALVDRDLTHWMG